MSCSANNVGKAGGEEMQAEVLERYNNGGVLQSKYPKKRMRVWVNAKRRWSENGRDEVHQDPKREASGLPAVVRVCRREP